MTPIAVLLTATLLAAEPAPLKSGVPAYPTPFIAVANSAVNISVPPVLHRAQLAKGLGFSAGFCGFVEHPAHNTGIVGDVMQPQFRVAHNDRLLVVQVYMPLPYRRPILARATSADELDRDDTVEVWIDPRDRDGRSKGDMFRIRGNIAGVAMFLQDEPSVGQYDMAWTTTAVFRPLPREPDGYWAAVIGVPWEDLGGAPQPGDTWGFQAAMRYADPPLVATLSPADSPGDPRRFARVRFDRNEHANVTASGITIAARRGTIRLTPHFSNPTAQARQVELDVTVLDGPKVLVARQQRYDLPAAQIHINTGSRFDVDFRPASSANRHVHAVIRFRDLSADQVILEQHLPLWKDDVDPAEAFDKLYQNLFRLAMGPYPATGVFEYQVDCQAMRALRKDVAAVHLSVTRDGRALVEATHNIDAPEAMTGYLTLPTATAADVKMPAGHYVVSAEIRDGGGRAISRREMSFDRRIMPFETEPRPGLSDIVVPPFTKPEISGEAVSCWNRQYRHGKAGLLVGLVAAEQDLLAAPAVLRIRQGDTIGNLPAGGSPVLTRAGVGQVEYRQSFAAGPISVTVTGVMDYDGFYLFTLTPKSDAALDDLQLVIPLKAEHATLFDTGLTSSNLWRSDRPKPIGFLPAGAGVVWDSLTWKDDYRSRAERQSNMPPYLWIGDDDRGLAFSCASDQGTFNDPAKPAVTIERPAPGRVELHISLLNQSSTMDGAAPVRIALHASPFQPMPEHYRLWRNGNRQDEMIASYTRNGRFVGKIYDYRANYPVYGRWLTLDYLRQQVEQSHKEGVDWVSFAASATSESGGTPEYQQFWRQWGTDIDWPLQTRIVPAAKTRQLMESLGLEVLPGLGEELPSNSCPSNVDFRVWWLAKGVTAGLSTVYQDNQTHLFQLQPASGYGYQRRDGGWEPTSAVWNSRQFLRRVAHAFVEAGVTDTPYALPHLCNVALPGRSFSRAVLLGEYGSSDLIPLDAFRVFTSRQWGYALFWLNSPAAGVVPRSYWRGFYSRLLLHDVTSFSRRPDVYVPWQMALDAFWLDDPSVQFHAYFRNPALTSGDGRILVSAYAATGRCLLIVSNQGDADGVQRLSWTHARPPTLGAVSSFMDLETGEPIESDAQGLTLFVPHDDYRLILGTAPTATDMALPVQSRLDRRVTVQRLAEAFLRDRAVAIDPADHQATAQGVQRLVQWLDNREDGAVYSSAETLKEARVAGAPLPVAALWNPKKRIVLIAVHNPSGRPLVLDEAARVNLLPQLGVPRQRYVRWLDDPMLGSSVGGVFDLRPGEARFELWHWADSSFGPVGPDSPAPSARARLFTAVLAQRARHGQP